MKKRKCSAVICKNGIKEYIGIALFCASIVFVCAILIDGYDLKGALCFGGATGLAMPLVLYGCACYEEHYVKKLRNRVESLERISCEGWAQTGDIDGWLFLSDEALEFYPCNENKTEYAMPIRDIQSISITPFTVKLYSHNEVCRFHVYRAFLWKRMISDAVKACK